MSEAEEVVTFNLKAVINKEKTRVLFAEFGNDFLDLIFSFLILPLGNIMNILQRHYGDKTPPHFIGSLNTLFNGLENLGCSYFSKLNSYKPPILNTETAYAFPHPSMKLEFSTYNSAFALGEAYFAVYKVFTKGKASFIICDDLRLMPNVKGSIVQTLDNVGIDMADMDGSETRDVTFGLNEVMDFLMASLVSLQPLTDIILGTPVNSELRSCKLGFPLHQIQTEAPANTKMMILKALFQKSTKKFLFAQAGEDFVSFLFGMLKIPLGLVDSHLGGNSSFNNLGNLYTSIADQVHHKIIRSRSSKDDFMMHQTFFYPRLYAEVDGVLNDYKPSMYMVTDDLTVTILYVTSALSFLDQMKISSSDVEEVEFHIELEEARNIFKASLTSSRALSDGLISPHLKEQLKKPKQEH